MVRKKRLRIIIGMVAIAFMLLIPHNTFAQCDPFLDPNCEDPDLEMPLDQWVILLAVSVGIFGIYKLHRQSTAAKNTLP